MSSTGKLFTLFLVLLGTLLFWTPSVVAKPLQPRHTQTVQVMPNQFRGFIDHSGKRVLSLPFDWFSGFHEGLSAFRDRRKKYGYLDRTGSPIIEPQFDDARDFSEGLAAVKVSDGWGYIDHSGKFVIKPIYKAAGEFSEGLARVYIRHFDSKTGFKTASSALIDKQGKLVVQTETFDRIESVHEGIAIAQKGAEVYFVAPNGESTFKTNYKGIQRFSEGLASTWLSDDLIGFVNRAGNIVCQAQGQNATPFSEGLSLVHLPKSKSLKIIDPKGKVVSQLFNLNFASRFSEGYAIVGTEGSDFAAYQKKFDPKIERFFVDRKGRRVFNASYHSAMPFSEGLAAVNFSIAGQHPLEESFERQEIFPDLYTLEFDLPLPPSQPKEDQAQRPGGTK